MEFEARTQDEVTVVGPAEFLEVDVGKVDDFRSSFMEAVGEARKVVLDASRVEFFDSAGLGVLLALKKKMAERQGTLVLAAVNKPVKDVCSMVGFDVVFEIFPDIRSAVKSLAGSS